MHAGAAWAGRIGIVVVLVCATVFFLRNAIWGMPVEGHRVARGDLRQTVVASGRVMSPHRISVAAETTGRVRAIPVQQGQSVRQGDVLIQLDDAEAQAHLRVATAGVAQAQAALRQQREMELPSAKALLVQSRADALQIDKQLVRMRQLNAADFVSAAELDMALRNLAIANSKVEAAQIAVKNYSAQGSQTNQALTGLAQAQASAQLAQVTLAHTVIPAPATGILITRSLEPGDIVQPGRVLMVLAAQGETQLEVQIDEKHLAKIALGQNALASADAFAERRFAAQVVYINPGINAARGSVEIKLGVKDPPAYLRQDMTVSVDIQTALQRNALVIPTAGLRDAAEKQPWVLVVRDKRARHQAVITGLRGDQGTEILQGVTAGEMIIFPSMGLVKAGQHVRVQATAP